jgi:hypothetical protein
MHLISPLPQETCRFAPNGYSRESGPYGARVKFLSSSFHLVCSLSEFSELYTKLRTSNRNKNVDLYGFSAALLISR